MIGYIGPRPVSQMLTSSLGRLECNGNESCGIALVDAGTPRIVRSVGDIARLEATVAGIESPESVLACGIGQTSSMAQDKPTWEKGHPYQDCKGQIVVVHSGTIENYVELKRQLTLEGHSFHTATDSEVIPHLIEKYFEGNIVKAVKSALREIRGFLAILVISTEDELRIVAAQCGSPLIVGLGNGENFVASDIPPLLPHTSSVIAMNDGEIAVIRHQSIELQTLDGKAFSSERIPCPADVAERQGFSHFMLKEIFEQPTIMRHACRGRLNVDIGVVLEEELGPAEIFSSVQRVVIVGRGSSRHAALVGEFFIESFARLQVEVDYAAEFRYRDAPLGPDTLVIAVTRSGETADTLSAMEEAQQRGAFVLSVCNAAGSLAARLADSVLYTRAGLETGVSPTKTFTMQLLALYLIGLFLARVRGTMTREEVLRRARLLTRVPEQVEQILDRSSAISALAEVFSNYHHALLLGSGINYPIALEGADKLKAISHVHADAYPTAELHHGPFGLIEKNMPVVILAPNDHNYNETLANLTEVKARNGVVLAIATEGDHEITAKADYTFQIPKADPFVNPFLSIIPLQLFAYHIAMLRGINVDKPRGLMTRGAAGSATS